MVWKAKKKMFILGCPLQKKMEVSSNAPKYALGLIFLEWFGFLSLLSTSLRLRCDSQQQLYWGQKARPWGSNDSTRWGTLSQCTSVGDSSGAFNVIFQIPVRIRARVRSAKPPNPITSKKKWKQFQKKRCIQLFSMALSCHCPGCVTHCPGWVATWVGLPPCPQVLKRLVWDKLLVNIWDAENILPWRFPPMPHTILNCGGVIAAFGWQEKSGHWRFNG